jgi:Raf kinase inhibitor-like YbhB/YbcL family protein
MKGDEMMKQVLVIFLAAILLGLGIVVFTGGNVKQSDPVAMLDVSSESFVDGQRLPVDFTCEGKNISPHIRWGSIPTGGKSFALICDDPDAPSKMFVHWVVFDIPANVNELSAGTLAVKELENGALQGVNDMGKVGYGGACPPRGHGVHRYFFTVYALDCKLGLQPGATRAELDAAMQGHILAKGCIIGRYSRP